MRIPYVEGDWDFWEHYDNGTWEPETKAVLERFLKPGDLFVDIGAWIGPVSLWALELGADVVAYEPDPVAFDQLRRNAPEVVAHQVAIGAETRDGHLANPQGFGNSMSQLADEGERVAVLSTEIASLDWPRIPTLIKVDVEGSEVDFLPDLAPWCFEHGTALYVSWHEDWWRNPLACQRRAWFAKFRTLQGEWGGFETLLAVP